MTLLDNARIIISSFGSMELYVSGDVDLSGNGVTTPSSLRPGKFMVFGTETVAGDQDITLTGTGDLRAAVYAPNANVTLDGNGRFYGAVSAYEVSFVGDTHFSFDTSLEENLVSTAGGYEPSEWIEIADVASSPNAVNMSDYGL
jgi:hypothetical protein